MKLESNYSVGDCIPFKNGGAGFWKVEKVIFTADGKVDYEMKKTTSRKVAEKIRPFDKEFPGEWGGEFWMLTQLGEVVSGTIDMITVARDEGIKINDRHCASECFENEEKMITGTFNLIRRRRQEWAISIRSPHGCLMSEMFGGVE